MDVGGQGTVVLSSSTMRWPARAPAVLIAFLHLALILAPLTFGLLWGAANSCIHFECFNT